MGATVGQLVASLYQSAAEPEQADVFIQQYAERLGASSGAVLVATDLRSGRDSVLASTRIDPAYRRSYEDHFGAVNVYIERMRRTRVSPAVRPGEAICPDDELVRTEYYNDYMRPQRLHYSLGYATPAAGAYVHLGATRPKNAGAFGSEETAVAEAVAAHLATAYALRERFAALQGRAQTLGDAVDRLPFGVFQLNARGKVLEANRCGAEMLRSNDGLRLNAGELTAALPAESTKLRNLVGRTTAAGRKDGVAPGGAMRLSRISPRRAYSVVVSPSPTAGGLPGARQPEAIAVVSDPEKELRCLDSRLCQMFGLTPAEAGVCTILLKGDSLKEVAGELRITVATARTHLNRILSKTETSRQSELMRLLMSVAFVDSLV